MPAKGKETKRKVQRSSIKKVAAPKEKKRETARKESSDFRFTFLENLREKKRALEELLESLIGSQKEYDGQMTAGDFIDEFDDAQREISTQSLYSLIERKSKELKKVEFLIKRITKEGEFGICEECGKQIPKERLLIMPEATLCVPCQREIEKSDQRRSLAPRSSAGLGGKKGVDWDDPEGVDDEGYMVKVSPVDSFSLADIQETEPDDAFLEKE
ncbi:MAG: TraR/DksA family transcriptional regulator [Pseudomonadota bacterium]